MSSRQLYMRFLHLLHALEGDAQGNDLDLEAKKLLEIIAVRHEERQPLTVTEAMALSHIASPATIHRKLDQLREVGLVEACFEDNNRRTKFLVPTQAALNHFETLGQALIRATKPV